MSSSSCTSGASRKFNLAAPADIQRIATKQLCRVAGSPACRHFLPLWASPAAVAMPVLQQRGVSDACASELWQQLQRGIPELSGRVSKRDWTSSWGRSPASAPALDPPDATLTFRYLQLNESLRGARQNVPPWLLVRLTALAADPMLLGWGADAPRVAPRLAASGVTDAGCSAPDCRPAAEGEQRPIKPRPGRGT